MQHFADRLSAAVKSRKNAVCVGLDPRFEQLPTFIREEAIAAYGMTARAVGEAFWTFNKALIDALANVVPVCKPQSAFYEEYGVSGIESFTRTVRYAREKGMIAICDAKRGDIGSTAVAYARAFLGGESISGSSEPLGFNGDALTVNPYMGADTLQPYLDIGATTGSGIFVLVKTSNSGSGDLQDLKVEGKPIYEHVAAMVERLGLKYRGNCGYASIGAVVGATYPEQLRQLRLGMPHSWFLIPGYGAQGGTAEDAALGFDAEGLGAIVNSSRGIIFAYKEAPYKDKYSERQFADAARAAALDMAGELNRALEVRRTD